MTLKRLWGMGRTRGPPSGQPVAFGADPVEAYRKICYNDG